MGIECQLAGLQRAAVRVDSIVKGRGSRSLMSSFHVTGRDLSKVGAIICHMGELGNEGLSCAAKE